MGKTRKSCNSSRNKDTLCVRAERKTRHTVKRYSMKHLTEYKYVILLLLRITTNILTALYKENAIIKHLEKV